jgi:hypothetical protein
LQTNRTIPIRNPDITISDNKQVTYILTNVALSEDRNVIKKRAEKILKYEDITIGIQRMWNVKAQVIPVITGPTGTILISFRYYLSNITGEHEIKELQKTTILCTAHILSEVLM